MKKTTLKATTTFKEQTANDDKGWERKTKDDRNDDEPFCVFVVISQTMEISKPRKFQMNVDPNDITVRITEVVSLRAVRHWFSRWCRRTTVKRRIAKIMTYREWYDQRYGSMRRKVRRTAVAGSLHSSICFQLPVDDEDGLPQWGSQP